MNPIAMAIILLSLLALFAWSARHRWKLLRFGLPTEERRFSQVARRLKEVWIFAFFQKKLRYYWWAGVAHQLIFLGFLVLLARSIVLWGRGFDPDFNLWILGPEPVAGLPLGEVYSFLKDIFATLVLLGTAVFFYYRVIRPQRRMALGIEGVVILGIIAVMMVADLAYDGAANVLNARYQESCGASYAASSSPDSSASCERAKTIIAPLDEPHPVEWSLYPEPGGSAFAALFEGASLATLVTLAHVGFWSHAVLVLVFLNILPYSKHFHIITAVPNVYTGDLTPRGRLPLLAASTEAIMERVEKASELEDMNQVRIGYARPEHFTWKDILDFYTCTECGRCSDNCPAFRTGKILSPKHFTLDLRDHLYARRDELSRSASGEQRAVKGELSQQPEGESSGEVSEQQASASEDSPLPRPVDLVPNVIHEDVLWACTTCRACEEQCPVNITYVDKIVQMRRHLVVIRGEFPGELNKPFEGMEVNGNPWNLARVDRTSWAEGLDIPTAASKPEAPVLFWVGCAASYDDRAKKIARATAALLKKAGVDFVILGEEETCTGDPARRAGNEYLFTMLAETNVQTINGYQEQGGIKTIVTTCPHCFNTLLNEYPDFGGRWDVVHHTSYLLGLMQNGALQPTQQVDGGVAFHDSCYLGRYNDVYDAPREILKRLPGVDVKEVPYWNKKNGLCCGAGGAQMWMEEQNKDRVNVKRTLQLLDTGAKTVSSACPFCMTMLTDGIKAQSKEDEIKNMDVAELLAIACGITEGAPAAPVAKQAEPQTLES